MGSRGPAGERAAPCVEHVTCHKLAVVYLVLLLLQFTEPSSAQGQDATPLILGRVYPGEVQYPVSGLFALDISPCLEQGHVLLELLSPELNAADVAFNSTFALPAPPPVLGNSNSSSLLDGSTEGAAGAQWNSAMGQHPPSSFLAPSSLTPMPLLLVNQRGLLPSAQALRPYEYLFSEGTSPVDFRGYHTQEPVQSARVAVPANDSLASPVWMLGVLPDIGVLGQAPTRYLVRASCPAVPVCPANCGGRQRGSCSGQGACQCAPLWGGPSCTTKLNDLALENGTVQVLGPAEWRYYYFEVTSPASTVLLEVFRTSGDLVTFMKPAADGYIPGGVPTAYDYPQFCDAYGFQNALSFQYIQWERAQPGGAYIALLNNVGDMGLPANLSFTLKLDPAGGPLCPRNCSYPNGVCQRVPVTGNFSRSTCLCQDSHAGPTCEANIWDASTSFALSGILPPRKTVYFRLRVASGANLALQITYTGGHLSVLFGTNGSIPTLGSTDVLELPVVSSGMAQDRAVQVAGVADDSTVFVGFYNSDRFLVQNSTIRIRFYYTVDTAGTFAGSPFMVVVIAVVGVLVLALVVFLFRRALGCASADGAPDNQLLAQGLEPPSVQPADAPRGLSKEHISGVPLVPFRMAECTEDCEVQCAVCLAEYEEDELLRQLPECHHMFHVTCVDRWFARHDTCPLCRASLRGLSVASTLPSSLRGPLPMGITSPEASSREGLRRRASPPSTQQTLQAASAALPAHEGSLQPVVHPQALPPSTGRGAHPPMAPGSPLRSSMEAPVEPQDAEHLDGLHQHVLHQDGVGLDGLHQGMLHHGSPQPQGMLNQDVHKQTRALTLGRGTYHMDVELTRQSFQEPMLAAAVCVSPEVEALCDGARTAVGGPLTLQVPPKAALSSVDIPRGDHGGDGTTADDKDMAPSSRADASNMHAVHNEQKQGLSL